MRMPKGADLHNHLSGAVYAESWIRAAAEDGLCVDQTSLAFTKPATMKTSPAPEPTLGTASTLSQPVCEGAGIAASRVPQNSALYDALIDAFSMRSFVPSAGVSGHDHFFATFARFGGTSEIHGGEWLDEVATRAAAQNEQYIEVMETPPFPHAAALAKEKFMELPSLSQGAVSAQEEMWISGLARKRQELLDRGLLDDVPAARSHIAEGERKRRALESCDDKPKPGCDVTIGFLYQVLRGFPPQQVFAQTLLGFEAVSADPRFVGINFVMPEDGYTSMKDYRLQMQMLDYLHSVYPRVHISLHAGELAPGLVPPEGLTFHIRSAVEQGHAERIGHGVDVMYEDRPYELLKEMATRHVLVEINLTSNDVILGVKGIDHPLPIYLRYGVPVALSTDDEGVSRIDLTHEYVSAAMTFPLTYRDLKKMVRSSIEHGFLSGESLWKDGDVFSQLVQPCAAQALGVASPAERCGAFLRSSEKARQQWELERRFRVFEAAQ
jgi:adenosine deaminase